MRRINRMLFVTFLLLVSTPTWSQPPDGARQGRGERAGGMMMAMRSVPVEQILGFFAFDEKVGVSNDQLGKIRDVLKDIHTQRTKLLEQLRETRDREMAMTEIRKLRGQMTQKLTAVLSAQQVEALKTYMQNMAQRGEREGQGRRGRAGGGAPDSREE